MYGEEMLASEQGEYFYQLNEQQRWLKERIWVTKDYQEIPVEEMYDAHLLASLHGLEEGGQSYFYDYHYEAVAMLKAEAVKRGLLEEE